MSNLSGTVSEERLEKVEQMVEDGVYDSKSEFVRFATRSTLSEKHAE